ncbi:MAG: hypothetical protein LBI94_06485, partial [Treponema sp.]|nr:hypothetical protein [Treponema sp.]
MNKRFPRRSGLLFPAAVLLFVCSCAGGPEQIPDVPVIRPSEQPARDTSADLVPEEPRTPPAEELREPEPEPEPEPEIPAGEEFLPEEKAGILLPPGISRDEPEEPLPEPSIDFAEISVEPQAPQEEALGLVLPEPPDPYFPDPPAESPAIVEAPAEPPVQPAAP